MKGIIIDKDGNDVKHITLSESINFLDTDICAVCEDISDYVGYYLKVSNSFFDNVYYGVISGYNHNTNKINIKLEHLIYDLDNIPFNKNYTDDTDITDILGDILDAYINNTSHGLVKKGTLDSTGKKIKYNFENASCLGAITIIQKYIDNGYLIKYEIGNGLNINLTQDTTITLNSNDVAGIGSQSIGGDIINQVQITNGSSINKTYNDLTSQTKYGIKYKKYIYDVNQIADADKIGNQILQDSANPKQTINSIEVKKTNLNMFNQSISYNNINYYITGGTIKDNSIIYNISLTPLIKEYVFVDYSNNITTELIKNSPDKHGLSTDIVVTPDDYNTVSWTSGNIYTSDGSSYIINGGSSGNMSSISYIYLDTDVSVTDLQITTVPANSVGKNKYLIIVAGPVSDTTKKAEFQLFGTKGSNKLITGDTIAGNTIAGNSIIANNLTSREINTSSINLSEWAGDLGNIADGTTFKKTTTNEKTGASRAYTAIDSNNVLVTAIKPATTYNPPTGTSHGLLIDTNKMGYYKNGNWHTYIDNTGNFYFTGDNNNYIQWNGTSLDIKGTLYIGTDLVKDKINTAQTSANTAQTTADSKIKTFKSSTAPSSASAGDLWYNTNTYETKRYDGNNWQVISDITEHKTSENTAKVGDKTAENVGTGVDNGNAAKGITDDAFKSVKEQDKAGNDVTFNIYQNWLESNEISKERSKTNYTGVVYDSAGLGGYKNGIKTFEINTNGDAFFTGTIGASSITGTTSISSGGYINVVDGKKEVRLGIETTSASGVTPVVKDPLIHFWTDVGGDKTDVGYLYGHTGTFTLADGSTQHISGIYSSNNIGAKGDCFIETDSYVGGTLVSNELWVFGGDNLIAGKLQIPVGTDLYT